MIRHCVFLRLVPDPDMQELAAVYDGLRQVAGRLDGAGGFMGGPNRDFEHKSQEYPHGFTIDFDDAAALAAYAADPEHQRLGARLVALCTGGEDGIIVFDLDV